MYSEVAWALVFSINQVQPQIILEPDHILQYLCISYDYVYSHKNNIKTTLMFFSQYSHKITDIKEKFLKYVTFGNFRTL